MADNRVIVEVVLDGAQGIDDINVQLGGLEESGEKASLGIGKIVSSLNLVGLARKGIDLVKNSLDGAFKRVETFERFDRAMTTITGSTTEAQKALDKTGEIVKGTAYGLDVAANSVQNFTARGLEVDKSTKYIEAMGDAVAFYGEGTNEAFTSVTDAMSKSLSKGTVHMTELNTLYDQGIQAPEMYAAATGRSVEEVQEALSNGEISAEQFFDVVTDVMKNGAGGWESIEGTAKEVGASWSTVFEDMENAVALGIMSIMTSIDEMLTSNGLPTMRDMVTQFGEKFEEILNRVVDAVPSIVEKILEIKNQLEPWLPLISSVSGAVVGMVAAWSTFNTAKNVIENVQKSFDNLNGIMEKNPWLLIIGAVIMAAILIYTHWEPIKEFFINLWESIKEIGLAVWEPIKEAWDSTVLYLMELFTPITEFFVNLWNGIVEAGSTIWNTLVEMLSIVWQNIQTTALTYWEIIKNVILDLILSLINLVTGDMEEFKSTLSAIWENIKEAASHIFDSILNIITGIMDGIKGVIDTVWNVIESLWLSVLETIANAVGVNFESIRSNVENILDAVKSVIDTVWDYIKNSFENVLNFLKSLVTGDFEGMKNAVKAQMENIQTSISDIWEAVKTIFSNVIGTILTVVTEKFMGIVNAVREKMDETKAKVEDGWGKARTFLEGIDLMQIGKDIIQGLINGIRERTTAVGNVIKEVTGQITGKIKSILGIASPSRVLMQIGKWTGEGLAQGIQSTRGLVGESIEELANAIAPNGENANLSDPFIEDVNTLNDVVLSKLYAFKDELIILLEILYVQWIDRIKLMKAHTLVELTVMKQEMRQLGIDAMQGLINGLESKRGELLALARSIANQIKATLASALEIHSPSRWMRDMIGRNMMLSWMQGIDAEKKTTLRKASEATDWMKPDVSVVNRLRGVIPPIGNVTPISGAYESISSMTNHNSRAYNPTFNNYFTRDESTPSDVARKNKQQSQRLATEWGLV